MNIEIVFITVLKRTLEVLLKKLGFSTCTAVINNFYDCQVTFVSLV